MSSYAEKYNAIRHKYLNRNNKKYSISTEGFFDIFKGKKKEDSAEKTVEDFVNLFTEQFKVIEKEIQESDKDQYTISSTLLGKVKTGSDLIKSLKGQVSFLKDLEKAQGLVVDGISACNTFTKKWSLDYENEKVVKSDYDKLLDYKVTYKNFPSLSSYKKENSAIFLTDKFETFFMRMNYSEVAYTSKYFDSVEEIFNNYTHVPGIHADFKFSRDENVTIELTKQEYVSFISQLKDINNRLLVLYKDYLDFNASKILDEVKNATAIYKQLVENQKNPELDSLIKGVEEIEINYVDGTYIGVCQSVVDAYVKYIHMFLNKQIK
jgi:hypothetical protein